MGIRPTAPKNMKTLPLTSVIIPLSRQRKEIDLPKLSELMRDISRTGLLHPIVLRSDADPTLVAGERRFRAAQALFDVGVGIRCNGTPVPVGEIPYLILGEASDLAYREAELSENVARVDLSWQDRTRAEAELHALRLEQNPAQTYTDTAKEVYGPSVSGGTPVDEISTSVKLSQYLSDPDVAKASSKKEAVKIVRAKLDQAAREALAREVRANPRSKHLLIHDDSRRFLPTIPDSSYDVILTDPPYGVDQHLITPFSGRTMDFNADHSYDDSFDTWKSLMSWFAVESFRVAKPLAHAYLFCDINNYPALRTLMEAAGWRVWFRPLIWNKVNVGSFADSEHGPRRVYETILYAIKGQKKTVLFKADVITLPSDQDSTGHPAAKPVALYSDLLSRSVSPGDYVLDPFAGGGPIFPSAEGLHAYATGVEQSPRYHPIAAARLAQVEGNGR